MGKKFFWLKLKNNFFNQPKIKKLRRLAGGPTYIIIYLKMQLLSIEHDGKIYFEGIEDDFVEEIALKLDEDVENVRATVAYLQSQGLMVAGEESDEFIIPEAQASIGTESDSKARVQAYRERKSIRENIPLELVRKVSNEQIILPDGTSKFFDNKRYGGNAEYVYELAECKCELCGSKENLVIHHNNGFSNDLEDLFLLCRSCHAKVENGSIKNIQHRRKSVTCNTCVTDVNAIGNKKVTLEIEKEIEIDKELDIEKDKIYSSEPLENASEPPVISLVLNDHSMYGITQTDINEWLDLYPAVDVMQQLRNMKGWLDSNPSKRKTRRGIRKFINGWLSREQDRGGSRPAKPITKESIDWGDV